jgi:superfamily II DNA or RNA helicase
MTRDERQNIAVSNWIKSKCQSSIVAATGFGKTRIALIAINKFLIKNQGCRIMIIVPTEVLQNQWKRILYEHGLFLNTDVKIINSAIKDNWMCDFLILDEVHRYNSETFRAIVEKANYKIILGLSATYERLDGLHKAIMDNYCPVCDEVSLEECIKNKWLSPLKQYLVLFHVDDIDKYHTLNSEFLDHYSFFNHNFDIAMKCATDYRFRHEYIRILSQGDQKKKELLSKIVHAHAFGFIRSLKARKEFIYNHPKKIEIANLILENRKDKKAITFWKTIKMAEQVKHGYVLHSGQSKKRRSSTMEEFSKLTSGVINSSKALIEGVDCPGLNLGIIGGLDSSKTTKTQTVGRIIRFEEGKEAELFVLCIANTQEDKWHRNSNTSEYITINEEQLRSLLTNQSYQKQKNKSNLKSDFIFRF